jgi:hypothetical protein
VHLVLFSFLFSGGITFGHPFSMDDVLFIVAIVLPPLISVSLILISRRDATPPNATRPIQ